MSLIPSISGLFKWHQFEPEVILLAVGWYLRFSLSYRDVDSSGATLDFLLSAKQDAEAAKRFLAKALGRPNHPTPRVIHTGVHGAYPLAIAQLKADGVLDEDCRHRVGRYLNNVVEQDHRAIKRRVKAGQRFRPFWATRRTLAGYEAVYMLRKGQAFGGPLDGGTVPLHAFVLCLFGFEG